ncbi:MAG: hypothetical protein V4674_01110 [Patescibacteria group bacterium]
MFLPIVLGSRYLLWHYSEGARDRFLAVRESSRATLSFFSIPLLLTTFFDPLLREPPPKETQAALSGVVGDASFLFLRIIGVALRSATISIGICTLFFVVMLELLFSVVWLFIPILLPLLFVLAILLLLYAGPAAISP